MDNQEINEVEPMVVEKPNESEDIKAMLAENLEMNKEILVYVKKINTYIGWQRIYGWVKFFIILIPIIIGVLYLPPFIRDAYQQLINLIKSGSGI